MPKEDDRVIWRPEQYGREEGLISTYGRAGNDIPDAVYMNKE
jgi:hypothetical protein